MNNLFLTVVAAGITFFIVHSEQGDFIRNQFNKWSFTARMITCSFCTGFWISLFVYASFANRSQSITGLLVEIVRMTAFGFAGAMVSLVLERIALMSDMLVEIAAKLPFPDDLDEDE